MKITISLLYDLDACSDQITLFAQLYPDGVSYETPKELQLLVDKASKQGLDIRWFIEKMKLSCVCREYYENGQLNYEDNYKDGRLEGVCRAYYEDGQLRYECNYKDGKPDGVLKEYYKNGQLKEQGKCSNATYLYY